MSYKQKVCHREGCDRPKRRGRAYRYCSDECAQIAHLAGRRKISQAWRDGNRTEQRAQRLWTLYRMTVEEFDHLLDSQGGRCAICRSIDPGGSNWHVDHDHSCCPGRGSCGRCRRGLLCAHCNRHVLAIVEGPLLDAALGYIALWKGRR